MPLLTQNREMRKIGAWNWTLPAFAGRLPDGRTYNTCVSSSTCRDICYARVGTYTWPKVLAKHQRNLMMLDDLDGWKTAMNAELAHPKFAGASVRWHDSGDWFSDEYLLAALEVFRANPQTFFYCYTREVDRFRRLVEPDPPDNFKWVFSFGGTQDAALDPDRDRVADVFPDAAAIEAAGFSSQEDSDLLAVLGPRRVGIPANNIPHLRKKLAGRSLSQMQADHDAAAAERRRRRAAATGGPPSL